MSMLSGLVGIGKIASNFLGGGAGDKVKESGSSTQNQTGQQTSKSSAVQSNNTRQFSDNFLQVLELVSKDALGSSASGSDALRGRLDQLQANPVNFDADGFVKGVMTAATDSVNSRLGADINGLVSATGGSTSGNSAAALLANRAQTEASANLAGVSASARAQAAEIQSNLNQSQTSQLTAVTQGIDAQLAGLLSALKGGESQQDISGNQSEAVNTSGTTTVSTSGTKTQPFNWAKAFGNIFDVDTDK